MAIFERSLFLLLSTICFCYAYPSVPGVSEEMGYTSLSGNEGRNYEISSDENTEPESRQAALVAALSAIAVPLAIGLFTPLVSMLGNAFAGRLQDIEANNAEPYNYDAYLVNMPNSPSPYLFLTNPKTSDDTKKNTALQTQKPSGVAPISSSSPLLGLPGLTYQTLSNNRKAAIKKLIGRINIKSQLPKGGDSINDGKISELRVIDSPSYDIYSDEIFNRRKSKELN